MSPKSIKSSTTCTQNSIVNLYKPVGPTSFDMVRSVRKILNVKKAGHIGTLDPLAEGILPICLNQATRIIQFLTPLPKVYLADLVLGVATDTQDATGKVLSRNDPGKATESMVRSVLQGFIGPQAQVPPMFSAKKKSGVPLYKLARNGITINRKPVLIHIHSLEFLNMEGSRVTFRVQCSSGTYVRTLCHDIGEELGCGAHMSRLVREKVGPFDLQTSLTLDALQQAQADDRLPEKLFQTETALKFLPAVHVYADRVQSLAHGQALTKGAVETYPARFEPGMTLRAVNGSERLLAIVEPVVNQDGFSRLGPKEVAFRLKRVLI